MPEGIEGARIIYVTIQRRLFEFLLWRINVAINARMHARGNAGHYPHLDIFHTAAEHYYIIILTEPRPIHIYLCMQFFALS